MLEKIRVSLWDIFTFFLTGFLVGAIYACFAVLSGLIPASDLFSELTSLPTSITIVVAPLTFTLIGMLVEPFANYFDRYVLNHLFGSVLKPKTKHSAEEKVLADEIKANYLGSLNNKISNPFPICKEYVETKQLSTTFMVFLSRYGFYRNCSFISILTGAACVPLIKPWYIAILCFGVAVFLSLVLKKRAEDFYSYLAPTVYRAFLIDKLEWIPAPPVTSAGSDIQENKPQPNSEE